MGVQGVGCGSMDWIDVSGQGQVAGACEHGFESSGFIKFDEFLA
jgi:hypothetical protein